jgi:hypothetical protein
MIKRETCTKGANVKKKKEKEESSWKMLSNTVKCTQMALNSWKIL